MIVASPAGALRVSAKRMHASARRGSAGSAGGGAGSLRLRLRDKHGGDGRGDRGGSAAAGSPSLAARAAACNAMPRSQPARHTASMGSPASMDCVGAARRDVAVRLRVAMDDRNVGALLVHALRPGHSRRATKLCPRGRSPHDRRPSTSTRPCRRKPHGCRYSDSPAAPPAPAPAPAINASARKRMGASIRRVPETVNVSYRPRRLALQRAAAAVRMLRRQPARGSCPLSFRPHVGVKHGYTYTLAIASPCSPPARCCSPRAVTSATQRRAALTRQHRQHRKSGTGSTVANDTMADCQPTRRHRRQDGEPAQKTGDKVDDAAITAKVKTALMAEPGLRSLEINVDTRDNIVTLERYGRLAGEEATRDADRAERRRREVGLRQPGRQVVVIGRTRGRRRRREAKGSLRVAPDAGAARRRCRTTATAASRRDAQGRRRRCAVPSQHQSRIR